MAEHAFSTPAPITPWGLHALIEYARASHIAIDSDESVDALFNLEAGLWDRLIAARIKGPRDARAKLDALLTDLTRRDEIDHVGQRLLSDVIRWLDGVAQ